MFLQLRFNENQLIIKSTIAITYNFSIRNMRIF